MLSLFLRALGCISRWECTKVREAFDKGGYNRTLVTALKSSLKGTHTLPLYLIDNYAGACFTHHLFPHVYFIFNLPFCLFGVLKISSLPSNNIFMLGHYQVACVTLVTGDVTLTPSGSNKEEYDDEAEIVREG